MLEKGLKHTSRATVDSSNVASAMGSGDMPVMATPALVALMENAAMLAVAAELPEGSTTVGAQIAVNHLAPSMIGAEVTATATVTAVEGRKISFTIAAYEGDKLIGNATHLRVVVERERFLKR